MSEEKSKNPTIEDLQKALGLLDYEVNMFRSLTTIILSDNDGVGVIHNALLESFLIHSRLLIEFLYADEPYKDTVLATQYFTPKKPWKSIRPPMTKLLEETKNDAHKFLAHLTFTRLNEKKQWLFVEIRNDIETVLQIFYKNLPCVL